MFSKHVRNRLSAYCHDELSTAETGRVAEHLIGCSHCRTEFEEIKLGVKLAEHLPLISAPETLWLEVEKSLNKDRNQAALGRWSLISGSLRQPRFAIPVFITLLSAAFIVGLALYYRSSGVRPAVSSWDVARLDGAPRIDSASIRDTGKISVGQWLVTDANSRAQINVGNIGQVEIDPDTRVRLVETKSTEHRLELARGSLSARISAPPRLFFVDTPSAVAEDLGCAYTLNVDDGGNSLLRVTAGWVSLHLRDRESVVPAGAACATRPGIGPGTPYFEDASPAFRQALTKLDFEPTEPAGSKNVELDLVLSTARPRDTFTLWHLLSRVNEKDRARVYERMAVLVPPPKGVTRDGVLRLDQDMLNRWREEIDASCDPLKSFPEAVRDVLGRIRMGADKRLGK